MVRQRVIALPTRLRRGFKFLGFAFKGAPDGFELISQLEACDALRQAKAPFSLAAQCIRQRLRGE